jgi:hypothetical protein
MNGLDHGMNLIDSVCQYFLKIVFFTALMKVTMVKLYVSTGEASGENFFSVLN